jgi:hypothetical protein
MRRFVMVAVVVASAVCLQWIFYPGPPVTESLQESDPTPGPASYYEDATRVEVRRMAECLRETNSDSAQDGRLRLEVCFRGSRIDEREEMCVNGHQSIEEDPLEREMRMILRIADRDDGSGEILYFGSLKFFGADGSVTQMYEYVIFPDDWRYVFYPA